MGWLEWIPTTLRVRGPRGLELWQWLSLPVLIAVAWLAGMMVGRLMRAVFVMFTRRTRATWDDRIAEGVGRPLGLGGAVLVAWLILPYMALPPPWEGPFQRGLRTALFAAFFWLLLRVVTVAGEVAASSSWAQARPASRSLVPLGARVLQVAVLAMAVVAVINDLGFPVTSLLAGLGIGGLALALAGQKTVENLFGAFSIGVDQPFRVGDFVSVEGLVMGTVELVGLRSTRIRTLERTIVTIPNGKLADMRIESFAPRDRIRFATVLGLSRSTTAAQTRALLSGVEQALRAQPKLWPDSLTVRFREITANALDVEVQAWFTTTDVTEFQGIRQELLLGFLDLVAKVGTTFAVPVREVNVRDGARI
jgi:MscS family membrane protein